MNVGWDWKGKEEVFMYNKSCKARGRSVLNHAQFLYFFFENC